MQKKFNDINTDELLDIHHNQFHQELKGGRMKNRVGLLIQYYNINLLSQEIAPFEGSSYFPLPKELRNPMKGLTNIQNKNNECFR